MHTLAILSLAIALVCALVIALDILRGHRQHMAVMNFVWPITALYAGPVALWAYFTAGRKRTHAAMQKAKAEGEGKPAQRAPASVTSAIGATHCGAGCTLADIVGDSAVAALGLTLFGHGIFAAWAVDFVLAFAFGIAFQYFAIVPMRHLSPGKGLVAAVKADALSLAAWQLGMYGFMALVVFVVVGHELDKTDPRFWFAMQLAMIAGFFVAWPVNAWLIRAGLKEAM